MTVLIFLGAEASQPFGIPTMTEMVTKFENLLKKDYPEMSWFYTQIKESLEKGFEICTNRHGHLELKPLSVKELKTHTNFNQ